MCHITSISVWFYTHSHTTGKLILEKKKLLLIFIFPCTPSNKINYYCAISHQNSRKSLLSLRMYECVAIFPMWIAGQSERESTTYTIIGLINRKINRVQHWIMEKYESFLFTCIAQHQTSTIILHHFAHHINMKTVEKKTMMSTMRKGGGGVSNISNFSLQSRPFSFSWHFTLFLNSFFIYHFSLYFAMIYNLKVFAI